MFAASSRRLRIVSTRGAVSVSVTASTRFTERTSRSQLPPASGFDGQLKRHSIPRPEHSRISASRSNASTHARISLSAPTKFVPLSLRILDGTPRVLTKLRIRPHGVSAYRADRYYTILLIVKLLKFFAFVLRSFFLFIMLSS